ncbi:MAG: NAD(P)/FAD-dependent oxidoreductase [Candidatus Hodarchaeales archaeon]|jgi:flavin-dependent dehydrogenase
MAELKSSYDVVIAGAGPAGCIIARDLAKNSKLSILLLESKSEKKLGHDWWDSVEFGIFPEVDLAKPAGKENLPQGKTRFLSPSGKTSFLLPPSQSYSIDRIFFGERLLNSVKATTAQVLPEAKVTGLVLRKSFPENEWFPHSLLSSDTFVTFREIRENTDPEDTGIANVWFGRHRGVQWISKDKPGLIDFFGGVIGLEGHPSPKELVKELIETTPNAGERVRGGYGGPIPVRRDFFSPIADGFLLVGDSAAQCNPIDGSGIASSMLAASQAAKTAEISLNKEDTSISALWNFNYQYKTTKGRNFAALDVLQKFLVFGMSEDDLDYLFKRRIVSLGDFWGAQDKSRKEGIFTAIGRLIRGFDRLGLLRNMKTVAKLVEEIDKHYLKLPTQFEKPDVVEWCRGVEAIYRRIPVQEELPWNDYNH